MGTVGCDVWPFQIKLLFVTFCHHSLAFEVSLHLWQRIPIAELSKTALQLQLWPSRLLRPRILQQRHGVISKLVGRPRKRPALVLPDFHQTLRPVNLQSLWEHLAYQSVQQHRRPQCLSCLSCLVLCPLMLAQSCPRRPPCPPQRTTAFVVSSSTK